MDLQHYQIDYHQLNDNKKNVFFLETENFKQIISGIHELKFSKSSGALIKTAGCGVTYASLIYQKNNSRDSFYINTGVNLKESLCNLLYKLGYDFRPTYTYQSVTPKFLIQAIKYHFESYVKDKRSVIILDDFHFLSGAQFTGYIDFIMRTKTVVNFCLVTTDDFLEKHNKRSDTSKSSQNLSKMITDWRVIEKVTFEERCAVCYIFGLRDQKLIDRLSEESNNLNDLYTKLKRIKRIAAKQVNNTGTISS